MGNVHIPQEGVFKPSGPILGSCGYIPSQTIRKAYLELDETPQTRSVCLRSLRQLIGENQEENNIDKHIDSFLLKFLQRQKIDFGDVYKILENYYEIVNGNTKSFKYQHVKTLRNH